MLNLILRWLLNGTLALVLFASSALTQEPKKYAFVVGVSDYFSKTIEFDLFFAEKDASDVGDKLKSMGFEVTPCLGPEASQEKLRESLNRFLTKLKKVNTNDVVLIMFSGHGQELSTTVIKPDGTKKTEQFPYFCAYDAITFNQERHVLRDKTEQQIEDEFNLISLNRVLGNLDESSNSVYNLLVVDACRSNPGSKVSGISGERAELRSGMSAFFSSRSGQESFESADEGIKNGVFTHFLLEGLGGKAANEDGELTWGRLVDYVTGQVEKKGSTLAGDPSRKQTPELLNKTQGSIVLSIRKQPIVTLYPALQKLTSEEQERRREYIRKELPGIENIAKQYVDATKFPDERVLLYPRFIRGRLDGPNALKFDLSQPGRNSFDAFYVELLSLNRNNHSELIREKCGILCADAVSDPRSQLIDQNLGRLTVLGKFAGQESLYRVVPELIRPLIARTTEMERNTELQHDRLPATDKAIIASLTGKYDVAAGELAANKDKIQSHGCYAVVAPTLLGKVDEAIRIADSLDVGYRDAAYLTIVNTLLDEGKTYEASQVIGRGTFFDVSCFAGNLPHPSNGFGPGGSIAGGNTPFLAFVAGRLADEALLNRVVLEFEQSGKIVKPFALRLAYLAGLCYDL
jgi:Caspase domain